jgi:hypothetical protein
MLISIDDDSHDSQVKTRNYKIIICFKKMAALRKHVFEDILRFSKNNIGSVGRCNLNPGKL